MPRAVSAGTAPAPRRPAALPPETPSSMVMHKVLDREALETLRNLQDPNEPDLVAEVTQVFFEDSTRCREAAERAFADKDPSALALAAHRLRGSAGLLGLQQLQQSAEDLEHVANVGEPTEWAARLFRMREAIDDAYLALREAALSAP